MNKQIKIGFVGLGLIGGSLAKAVKKFHPACEIVAFDTDHETLLRASEENIVDTVCKNIGTAFSECSYIFLCAPVIRNAEMLGELKPYLSPDCILSDVGSVKTSIHKAIIQADLESQFIGGHPMAGSERSGYASSKAELLENAYFILTPSAKVPEQRVQEYADFVSGIKGLPMVLDYNLHDYLTGTISHLPHIIAASLVNFVRENDTPDELMKRLAAGGFKDITRIASSSPVMWENICLMNKDQISSILKGYIDMLEQTKTYIDNSSGEQIFDFFSESRNYRDSITEFSSGSIKKEFSLYCDIIDEAGGIATLATILATNHINIKNIGIIHNREYEEGVLKVEFYDEASSKKAAELLQKFHYTVYQRK